jgi:hypothetical protein
VETVLRDHPVGTEKYQYRYINTGVMREGNDHRQVQESFKKV